MNTCNCFSDVTVNYLNCFQEILNDMIRNMTSAKPTDSISHTFIVQMIPHHMAAIKMSRNLLQYTTFIPLQNIAQNIITEQTKSIQDMECVNSTCEHTCNSQQQLCSYLQSYDQITETMFLRMKNACSTNDINANFIREMIPHHMGAVEMSKSALSYDICPELKPILQSIITSQERGIRQMKCLLCER